MATKSENAETEVIQEDFMRLDQYIDLLKELRKKEGNLPITYAQDDEGNGYEFVRYSPSAVQYSGILNGKRGNLDILDDETAKTTKTKFKAACIN